MKRVTLDSLAAELRISKYSVSRALRGKRGVSDETRKRVVDAARALGYRHAAVGPRRRAGGQDVIVLLIPHRDVADVEFWMGVIAGAGRVAEDLGYKFVTRPLEVGDQHQPVGVEQIAGVIVAGLRARPAACPYLDAGVAVAMVTYPTPLEPVDVVGNADDEGGIAVARHFLELGHRRLAFVTEAPDKPSFAARSRGFTEAAAAEGLAVEQIVIDPERPGATFERRYRELAKKGEGPTGVFASTDAIAFAVAWALGRLSLNVPRDVSLVGFNDGFESTRFVPRLTTLRAPTQEMGAATMRFLHDRIEGGDGSPRRLRLAPTLVVRESTAAAGSTGVTIKGVMTVA
jgi:LacI family transcriptional regulator